jgi:HK97 family phage portal protein
MDNRLIGLWPQKPLAQLVGAKLNGKHSTNGNGKKALVFHDEGLFWRSEGGVYGDTPGLQREIRGFNAYAVSALAYACMRFRANKLTEAPLWIAEETNDGESWVDDHELSEVLEQPNPDMEMADLLECLSLYMDITGRALLVKTRDRGDRVAALYPFSGDEFTVEQADGRLYGKFRVNTSKGQKTYGPEDVVFFRNTDPRSPLDGLAPLDAALSHLNISDQMRRAVNAQLRNAARPGAVLNFPNGLSDNNMAERVKAEFRANYAGAVNDGKLMVVEGTEKEMQFLDSNLKNLAFGPVQEDVEATVCSVFEVHPVLVHTKLGLTANSGLADTMEPALKLFYDRFFFPATRKIEKTLTRSLLREVDDNKLRFIRFDTSKIAALQDNIGQRVEEAQGAADIWTVNERRTHTGKDALEEGGDEIRVRAAQPVAEGSEKGMSSAPEAKRAPAPREPAPTNAKADLRMRLWRKFDAKARREESKYKAEAEKQFAKEKAEVIARLAGSSDSTVQAVLKKLETAYTTEDGQYHLEWLERYEKLVATTFEVAGSDLGAELGFDFSLENPRVQTAIAKRANKLAGNVTETTYGSIRDEVSKGRSAGEGISEIASRIRDNVFDGEITKARAETIARTETVGALNHGELIAARESGVVTGKRWLTQGDGKVRDSHAEIDDELVPLDDVFSNGLRHPGDQAGDAAEVVNCRCTTLYETDEVTE